MADESITNKHRQYDVAEKWGTRVAQRGFAQIPNYLLLLNSFIADEDRLTPLDLLLLVELAGTWWKKEEMPFPSISTLARRCGTSDRQLHRSLNRLEELDLLKRKKRNIRGIVSSNLYDLGPLVETLDLIAKRFPASHKRRVGPQLEGSPSKPLKLSRNIESD